MLYWCSSIYQSVFRHFIVAEIFKDLLQHTRRQVQQVHFCGRAVYGLQKKSSGTQNDYLHGCRVFLTTMWRSIGVPGHLAGSTRLYIVIKALIRILHRTLFFNTIKTILTFTNQLFPGLLRPKENSELVNIFRAEFECIFLKHLSCWKGH